MLGSARSDDYYELSIHVGGNVSVLKFNYLRKKDIESDFVTRTKIRTKELMDSLIKFRANPSTCKTMCFYWILLDNVYQFSIFNITKRNPYLYLDPCQ